MSDQAWHVYRRLDLDVEPMSRESMRCSLVTTGTYMIQCVVCDSWVYFNGDETIKRCACGRAYERRAG